MQMFDSFLVGRSVAAQFKHEVFPFPDAEQAKSLFDRPLATIVWQALSDKHVREPIICVGFETLRSLAFLVKWFSIRLSRHVRVSAHKKCSSYRPLRDNGTKKTTI